MWEARTDLMKDARIKGEMLSKKEIFLMIAIPNLLMLLSFLCANALPTPPTEWINRDMFDSSSRSAGESSVSTIQDHQIIALGVPILASEIAPLDEMRNANHEQSTTYRYPQTARGVVWIRDTDRSGRPTNDWRAEIEVKDREEIEEKNLVLKIK
jgi:hypothetical protein